MIWSLSKIVRSRWATKTDVRFFSRRMLLMFARSVCSVYVSSAEVYISKGDIH